MQFESTLKYLQDYLDENRTNSILFLNSYPTTEEQKTDGYFKRVLFIDNVFDSYLKCYINESKNVKNPVVERIFEKTLQINIPIVDTYPENIINLLVTLFPNVYAHSIYPLLSNNKKKIFLNAVNRIWDVHGIVPEEHKLKGDNAKTVEFINTIEKCIYEHASIIIVVTNALKSHLSIKYRDVSQFKKKHILLPLSPIYVEDNIKYDLSSLEKPIVIYSGGNQIWQQVDKMLDFVYENKNKFRFIFLSPNFNEVREQYSIQFNGEIFPGVVNFVTTYNMPEYYKIAHYGLVLREDIDVNHVSCPTKLIDYMSYGIVPIVDCEDIGDFKENGYKFLQYNNINVLKVNDYLDFKRQNSVVINKIGQQSKNGCRALLKCVSSDTDEKSNKEILLYNYVIGVCLRSLGIALNSKIRKLTKPLIVINDYIRRILKPNIRNSRIL